MKLQLRWMIITVALLCGIAGLKSIARARRAAALAQTQNQEVDSGMLARLGTQLGVVRAPLTKVQLEQALAQSASFSQFPTEMILPGSKNPDEKAIIEYSFDAHLQETMEAMYRNTMPDHGAFVALDAHTGRILSMVSYSKNQTNRENMALQATFPSASVFKVVTAAAAISESRFSGATIIPFTGQNHTLYRSNVFKTQSNRWTRYATLKDAFAKSINTVFGKIGAYNLRAPILRDYADRFGFNRKIASDMPMQEGHAPIPDDPWGIAEAASGYTRENTMSPLQGALIAASVLNDGVMMEPYMVQSVYQPDGTRLYTAIPTISKNVIDASTAHEIRSLMRETIVSGTCRKTFHGFSRGQCSMIDVGGKTGTLTGLNPPGKYDWFIGFAEYGGKKFAFASLTIHEKYWRVKSSTIARKAIETYFKDSSIRAKL